ncbi:MAG: phosphate acetyltransferase [Rhodobacteraceae bacterium]|nr:phosphate acetyltransferase [Paracoccaceae bacterium]
MSVLEQALAIAKAARGRVILPEYDDPRTEAAAKRILAEGLADCVCLDDARPPEAYLPYLQAARPGIKDAIALKLLKKPLYLAGAMVAAGEADALIAGAATPTRRVIEAAAMTIGMAEGVSVPSSFFLIAFRDGRELIFADCAVNVAPDAAELAAIAVASARSAEALLGSARLAMLSFSTGASGSGASVDLVAEATARVAAEGLNVVGPVQADAALNRGIAAKKGISGGDANVLIFPSLDAGNIAYKLAQELAGAQAVGPFLQGFARPVCDLSRGATVDDIVAAAAVTLAMR